ALLEIELDLGSFELPRAIALRARRKEKRRQRQLALPAGDENVAARAAGGLRRDLEAGFTEGDALVYPIEYRVLTEDARVRALVDNAARELDPLLGDAGPVAGQDPVAVLDADVARDLGSRRRAGIEPL